MLPFSLGGIEQKDEYVDLTLNRKRHDVRLDIESNDMILIQIESNHYRIESQPNPIEPNPIRKPNPNLNPPLPANRVQPCPKPGMTTANRVQPCPKASPTVVNRAKPCPTVLECVPNHVSNIHTSVLNHVQPCHLRWAPCPTVSLPNNTQTYRV